jgi:hypothetical protein
MAPRLSAGLAAVTDARVCVNGCRYHHRHATDCPDNDQCPGCLPRPADVGGLCQRCYDQADRALEQLPRMWADLEAHLPPGAGTGQARVSGTPEKRIGMALGPADARLAIERVLASWVEQHAEELGHHPPVNGRNPRNTAPWLHTRLEWAADQDWVDDYTQELRDLTRAARGLLNPSGRRRLTQIGPCPEDDCPGTLTATLAASDELLPPSLNCTHDPAHVYSAHDWRYVGRRANRKDAA